MPVRSKTQLTTYFETTQDGFLEADKVPGQYKALFGFLVVIAAAALAVVVLVRVF